MQKRELDLAVRQLETLDAAVVWFVVIIVIT
jgi:hypothetical protein